MTEQAHQLTKASALGHEAMDSSKFSAFRFFYASWVARMLSAPAAEPDQPISHRSERAGPKRMNIAMAVERRRKEEEEQGSRGVKQRVKVK